MIFAQVVAKLLVIVSEGSVILGRHCGNPSFDFLEGMAGIYHPVASSLPVPRQALGLTNAQEAAWREGGLGETRFDSSRGSRYHQI